MNHRTRRLWVAGRILPCAVTGAVCVFALVHHILAVELPPGLEWSGIDACEFRMDRVETHTAVKRTAPKYALISDSAGPGDDRVYIVRTDSGRPELLSSLAVRSPGGGKWPNRDWEDLAVGAGSLWILDNIRNGGSEHSVLHCTAPSDPAADVRVREEWRFRYDGDVEALFLIGGQPYVIPKKWNGGDLVDAVQFSAAPHNVYKLVPRVRGKFYVDCELELVKRLGGIAGFCSGADYRDGVLILNCQDISGSSVYLIDWPDARTALRYQTTLKRGEGVCLAVGHERRFLVQNEKGRVLTGGAGLPSLNVAAAGLDGIPVTRPRVDWAGPDGNALVLRGQQTRPSRARNTHAVARWLSRAGAGRLFDALALGGLLGVSLLSHGRRTRVAVAITALLLLVGFVGR